MANYKNFQITNTQENVTFLIWNDSSKAKVNVDGDCTEMTVAEAREVYKNYLNNGWQAGWTTCRTRRINQLNG